MVESQTIGIQVKQAGKAETTVAIMKSEGDIVILRSENPNLEIHFNYVPLLEFLYGLDRERKKVKIKRM